MILGIFPSLQETGGIQTVGRMVWNAVSEDPKYSQKVLFTYGASSEAAEQIATPHHARGRIEALRVARRLQGPFEMVLVGHLNFLKLLPFIKSTKGKIVCFLYGIEAWQKRSLWAAKQADLFLPISGFTWSRFIERNPACSVIPHRIVPPGIGQPRVHTDGATQCAALMISRLEATEDYKGHREMIAAWPSVVQEFPEAQLWIVGEGALRSILEKQSAALTMGSSVRFYGKVSDAKKQELLQQCRFLAMPSRGEGFGFAYLEAMRHGKPCLVSNLDAGREVVHPPEAGLEVDPGSPDDLVQKISRLLSTDSEWKRMSQQAIERYESFYTEAHFRRRFLDAMHSLS